MEDTEDKSQPILEKPVSRRTFLKGAVIGALGFLGIQKAIEQASKIDPEEIKNNLETGIRETIEGNDMRNKLMPNRLPPKEVQDDFVKKYKETMNPPVPIPTLERPKR